MEPGVQFTEVLAWLTLVVAFPLCLVAAYRLRKRVLKAPRLGVLGERYRTAIYVTGVVLFFGLIFVNNDQAVPPLDLDTTKWVTRLTILGLALFSAGGLLWLDWRLGRKKGG